MQIFDDLDEIFEGRLREHRIVTKSYRSEKGEITVTSATAIVESRFNFSVLDRLHDPCFIAIERETAERPTYLIYEAVTPAATHFQMLGMDVAMPTIIRKEFLDTISKGWGKSDETWIDIVAVPTRHRMDIVAGEPVFEKSKLMPLTGTRVHLLSTEAVKRFLCVEKGQTVGTLLGFQIPLIINIKELVRYHSGTFGYTGSGKSNLTSYLVRKALEDDPDLKVVVFDVAGEYAIYLLDILMEGGEIFSTEECDDPDKFLSSQVIPETLEEKLGGSKILERCADLIVANRMVRPITLLQSSEITLEYIIEKLEGAATSNRAGAVQAKVAIQKLQRLIEDFRLKPRMELTKIPLEVNETIRTILGTDIKSKLNERTALHADVSSLIEYLEMTPAHDEAEVMSPSGLAQHILSDGSPRLSIIHVPEPNQARSAISNFLNHLLMLKKSSSLAQKKRILVVLDEAQEFIPDRAKTSDYSENSNMAVESLLRHGRKYRAHCWLSTQRVAHLNVNALHQLHSYFVSILPRSYDRWVIAEAFSLNTAILDKTVDLDTGEWLFVSYKATRQKNIPTFIKAPDNEEIVATRLKDLTSQDTLTQRVHDSLHKQ
jgi:hypothetical protein